MGRFDTQRRDANGQNWPAQPWVAVVRYSYSGEQMSVADRMINPLGFKVTSYRKSAAALERPEPARADNSTEARPNAAPAEQNAIARSDEHPPELQFLRRNSYAAFSTENNK